MDKELKKLYDYCKSQGYEGSPEKFEKEFEDLTLKQLGNEELSKISGGKKATTAFAASLMSVLSIASPFASAHSNPFTSKKSTGETLSRNVVGSYRDKIVQKANQSTFDKYKEKITSSVKQGIDYAKKNQKTIEDILIKGVLPVGGVLGVFGTAGTIGLIAKSISDSRKTLASRELTIYKHLLKTSFKQMIRIVDSLDYDKKATLISNIDSSGNLRNKLTRDEDLNMDEASQLCLYIAGSISVQDYNDGTTQNQNSNLLMEKIKEVAENSSNFDESGKFVGNQQQGSFATDGKNPYSFLGNNIDDIFVKISNCDCYKRFTDYKIISIYTIQQALLSSHSKEKNLWNQLLDSDDEVKSSIKNLENKVRDEIPALKTPEGAGDQPQLRSAVNKNPFARKRNHPKKIEITVHHIMYKCHRQCNYNHNHSHNHNHNHNHNHSHNHSHNHRQHNNFLLPPIHLLSNG